jgi:hypothetical protein
MRKGSGRGSGNVEEVALTSSTPRDRLKYPKDPGNPTVMPNAGQHSDCFETERLQRSTHNRTTRRAGSWLPARSPLPVLPLRTEAQRGHDPLQQHGKGFAGNPGTASPQEYPHRGALTHVGYEESRKTEEALSRVLE